MSEQTTVAEDFARCKIERKMLREQVAHWIEGWYGERCAEAHTDCGVCQKWAAFDALLGVAE